MQINEYDAVQFVVRWMIENKAGNDVDISDAYTIEKIVDQCHGDMRKHRNGVPNNVINPTS
jgi:hypothetical protein